MWSAVGGALRSPYRGLKALDVEDASIFFGREAPTIRAIDQIRGLRETTGQRLFVIIGASGSGKSSFIRAGFEGAFHFEIGNDQRYVERQIASQLGDSWPKRVVGDGQSVLKRRPRRSSLNVPSTVSRSTQPCASSCSFRSSDRQSDADLEFFATIEHPEFRIRCSAGRAPAARARRARHSGGG